MSCKKIFGLFFSLVLLFNLVGCKSEKEKQEQMRKEEEARKAVFSKIYEEYYNDFESGKEHLTDKEYIEDYVNFRDKFLKNIDKFLKENKFNDENITKVIEKYKKTVEDKKNIEKDILDNKLENSSMTEQVGIEYLSLSQKPTIDGDFALIELNDKYGFYIIKIDDNKMRYKELTEKVKLNKGQEYNNGHISVKINKVKHDPYFGETYLSSVTSGKKIYRVEFEVMNIKTGDNYKIFGGGVDVPHYIIEARDNDGYVYNIYDTDNTSLTQRGINEGEKAKYVLTFAASGVNPKEMTIKLFPYQTKTEFIIPVEE